MNFTSNTVQANGITQHYYRSGGDKPPLVLMHGFTDDGTCWFPVAEPLAQDYDLIMLDARGHGKSARVAGIEFSNAAMADDAAALIKVLGLQRPAVLAHSMGAANALILTATYPELVSCLLLEDPPLAPPFTPGMDAEREALMRDWGNFLREAQAQSLEDLIASEQQRSPRWSSAEWQTLSAAKHRLDMAVFEGSHGWGQWQTLMQQVQCPVLLLYGDTSFVTEALAQEAAALWQTGRAVQILQSGHNIRRDNLADYLQAVREFLQTYYPGQPG